MKSAFPRDPPGPFAAAPTFGWLVASGLMGRDEALRAMWEAADQQAAPDISRSGLRSRIAWALTDATLWADRMRENAVRDVRRHLAPLLARRAPWQDLIRTAHAVNNDAVHIGAQPMLHPHEINEIVAAEIAWWARRSNRR